MLSTELPAKGKVIIFDLDGTLACGKHRLHLLPKFEDRSNNHAWEKFNLACADDAPIQDNIDLCNILYLTHHIVILTGRGEVAAKETVDWLDKHGVHFNDLIMRGRNDHSKDTEFKERILKPAVGQIVCAFDDLEHVAEHLRGMGITCHLVTKYHEPLLHQQEHHKEECDHLWSAPFKDRARMQVSRHCRNCDIIKEVGRL